MISLITYKKQSELNAPDIENLIFGDLRVEVITISGNSRYEAFNLGLMLANGDYVIFSESLDEYVFHSLERLWNSLDYDEDVIFCDYSITYDDGIRELYHSNIYHSKPSQMINSFLFSGMQLCLCSILFKKQILLQNGITFRPEVGSFTSSLFCIESLTVSRIIKDWKDSVVNHLTQQIHKDRNINGCQGISLSDVSSYILELHKALLKVFPVDMVDTIVFRYKISLLNIGALRMREFQACSVSPIRQIVASDLSLKKRILLLLSIFFCLLKKY